MERFSRLIALVSLMAGGAAYAFFAGQFSANVAWASAAAFAISFGLAKISLPLGLAPALLLAYTAPAVLMVGFGTADYHHLLIWMALLAGPIFAASDWSKWHVPGAMKAPVIGWAVVIAVTWPIIALREVDFSLIAARTLDTPNGMLGGPPPAAAAWIVSVAVGQLLGILWLDLLWSRFGADRVRRAERVVLVPLILSITAAAVAGTYQKNVDINWLNVGDWPSLGRASGLMLDANSFGTAAALWAPLTIALVWRLRRPVWIGAATSALLLAGVWASGSRTALLIAVVGWVALVVAGAQRVRAWQTRIVPLALLLAGAALVVVVALQSDDRSNPLARLLNTLPRAETGGLAKVASDLWNRDGYGLAATRAIQEHPWSGLGVGAFNQLSSDYFYLATGGLIRPDNAQNWWRHQIAELGFVGAAPSVLLSLVVLLLLWTGHASGDHRPAATIVRGVLTGVGLASMLGLATQHPALFLTFMTLLYWFGALLDPALLPARERAPGPVVWGFVWAVTIFVAAGQIASASGDLRVPMRALRLGFPYGYGFSAVQTDPQLGEMRWTDRRAVGVLRAEHAYFAITASTPQASPNNPVHVRLWRGAEMVANVESRGPEPLSWLVQVPDGQRFLMVETEVSRPTDTGQGMKMAGRWLREVPPGTPPATIIR